MDDTVFPSHSPIQTLPLPLPIQTFPLPPPIQTFRRSSKETKYVLASEASYWSYLVFLEQRETNGHSYNWYQPVVLFHFQRKRLIFQCCLLFFSVVLLTSEQRKKPEWQV